MSNIKQSSAGCISLTHVWRPWSCSTILFAVAVISGFDGDLCDSFSPFALRIAVILLTVFGTSRHLSSFDICQLPVGLSSTTQSTVVKFCVGVRYIFGKGELPNLFRGCVLYRTCVHRSGCLSHGWCIKGGTVSWKRKDNELLQKATFFFFVSTQNAT